MILEDEVVIITGASWGLGAAMAKRFVREGASITITARSESELGTVAGAVEGEMQSYRPT